MKHTIGTFSFFILLFPTLGISAWDFSPNIQSAISFTDNVELASSNEDSEVALEVSPGFALIKAGGRLQANVNYVLQNILYEDDSDRDESYNQLDAFASLEVLRERFFIDTSSTISQQIVDPEGRAPSNNIIDSRNTTDRRSFYVNPNWREGVGDFAELFLSYSKSYLDYDDNRVADRTEDSETDSYEAAFGNLNDYHRIGLEVFYDRVDEEGDETDLTDTFERYGLNIELPINGRFTLLGVVGDEENDFERQSLVDVPEGEYWEAGFRWSANVNNTLELRYGDRDFGNTRFMLWERVGGKLALSAGYEEDLETDSTVFFGREFGLVPINNFEQDGQGLTDQIFERERFDAEAILNTARGEIGLAVFDEERKFLESPDNEDTQGVAISWDWRFATRTSLLSELEYTRRDLAQNDQDFDTYRLNARAEREFGKASYMFVEYGHDRRESDVSAQEYDENYLGTGVFLSF